jgi:hypothetical protein
MAKSAKRLSDTIRCVNCGSENAYERFVNGEGWDIFCPDCLSTFDWNAVPRECRVCKMRLRDVTELGRGLCPKCHLATFSSEKRAALNKLISMAFKKPEPTDAEKDTAIDEAFKHFD